MPNLPLLSIGIIFRDEIRCLERCLESLQPLREAIPCELVMADTGSVDGSRAVAARYADVLFDFPWQDDFSAARNALLEHASGTWYLSIDADEWLDEDLSELISFLQRPGHYDIAAITIRNYRDMELKDYEEQRVTRIYLREGGRYHNPIHEIFIRQPMKQIFLHQTVFHHDGYVVARVTDGMAAKHARNMAILEKKLQAKPNDLHTLVECIESSHTSEQARDYVQQGIRLIESTWPQGGYAPNLLRYAVRNFMELGDTESTLYWAKQSFLHYPDSILVQIDCSAAAMIACHSSSRWEESIAYEERWAKAVDDYKNGRVNDEQLLFGTPFYCGTQVENYIRYLLFLNYCNLSRSDAAQVVLGQIDFNLNVLYIEQICMATLKMLATESDFLPQLIRLWKYVKESTGKFTTEVFSLLAAQSVRQLPENMPFLAQMPDEPGISAHILSTTNSSLVEDLFQQIQDWRCVFPEVYVHLIRNAISIPQRFFLRSGDDISRLALSLTDLDDQLGEFLLNYLENQTPDLPAVILWEINLIIAVFQSHSCKFANTICNLWEKLCALAKQYFEKVYQPTMLVEPELMLLPTTLRFACYAVQAQNALEQGDPEGYISYLRAGLNTAPQMNQLISFLIDMMKKRQNQTPELLQLAEQVRNILAQYPPDDPVVDAIKQSDAYRKVAYLIEGMEAPVWGGFPQ